jgi:L-lysine exporter family protein LysE/ArgO
MTSSAALLAALSGLGLGLGLIVAIGAQNAFVLRQGLRGEHLSPVIMVCILSDVALIAAGVLGAGALLGQVPWMLTAVRLGGAAFLLGYGLLAARRALRPSALESGNAGAGASLAATLGTCLMLTWLNPHVYLDTVVLLGSIAQTHAGGLRWWFTAGAAAGSGLWFCALGYGARLLRPVFARPAAWRVLDVLIATVMTTLAVTLALG